jgi:tetratricopeptide (TPR) repeat protein
VLEEAGYKVVIQAWDFRPGSNFVLEMNQALKEAERVLAVLSPDFVTSHFTAPEWAAAFAHDPTGKDRKLIPVRVREADLSGLLGQIHYIDFVGSNDEAVTRRLLLDGVKPGRGKPERQPAFPAGGRTTRDQPRFPGSLPPIWNVPHTRNRNFTGRDDLLTTLRSRLLAGHCSALTALHGLGGIGKTQTAVEYASRHASEYDLVWWIRSENRATLAGDFALLASKLGLPEADADQPAALEAVKRWLSGNSGWLLVFDNARDPADIRSYLPAGAGGHVIITSRSPNWRSIAEPLPVAALSPDDAITFLQKRSGQQDHDASRDLVEALGWLPLAIEQAAAYIDVHGTPISVYSDLFRKHRQGILGRGKPFDYRDTVETTWELSFTEVRSQSPAGADLLRLCAFLAPDGIPLEIVREGKKRLPEPLRSVAVDEFKLADALSALRRHSLVERTGDVLSVHRLVQAVVRDRMESNERQVWIEAAAGVVHDAFPYDSDDVATWPACARLLAHATTTAAHCEAEGAGLRFVQYLLGQSALYLRSRADFVGARALNERALAIEEKLRGADHGNVAVIVSNLGGLLIDLGEMQEARRHYERALDIGEAVHGPDHPQVATYRNNLGIVLQNLGELDEAKKNFERALEIGQAVYGPCDPIQSIRINNLGRLHHAMGNLAEARVLLEHALRIDEAVYGPDHPNVARVVSNLGCLLQSLGDLAQSRELHERALRIDEAFYGPDHPTVGDRINNLGLVLQDLGDLEDGRKLIERSLKIAEAAYGAVHPDVAVRLTNLGMILQLLGDLSRAQDLLERALEMNERLHGPDHPTVAKNLNNLGILFGERGEDASARACFARALKIVEGSLGPDHPQRRIVTENLRSVDRSQS